MVIYMKYWATVKRADLRTHWMNARDSVVSLWSGLSGTGKVNFLDNSCFCNGN